MTRLGSITPHFGVAWSLLWRATVLFPLCLLATATVFGIWIGRYVLPVYIALNVYIRDWPATAVLTAAWVSALVLWRSTRLQAALEDPPSLL